MSKVVVVAGEASGDRAAAPVVARLKQRGVEVFGMGGDAIAEAGGELVARLEGTSAMGIGDVARLGMSIAAARAKLVFAIRAKRPRAALLVNYTEFNMTLAATLKANGIRVLWYIAPQIWAWRKGRAKAFRRIVDRMAVILPFEEALWKNEGVDAKYVGHPALEDQPLDRSAARARLGLTAYAKAVALLPGSRPHEVRRLLQSMFEAYEIVRRDRASLDARLLIASSLDAKTVEWATDLAREWRVPAVRVDARTGAYDLLRAFDATLCASGTASLEAAFARAVPVVTYRVGLTTELFARAFLRTSFVALPNVILQRMAFPELLQRDARTSKMVRSLEGALGKGRKQMLAACDELLPLFGDKKHASSEVAEMMAPWL